MTSLLMLVVTSCRETKQPTQHSTDQKVFSPQKQLGWFHGSCLVIPDQPVSPATNVDLVITSEPQSVLKAKIGETLTSAPACQPLADERKGQNARPGTSFYAIKNAAPAATDMGIAIVDPPHEVTVVNGLARTDLTSDGHYDVFSSCATSEGINFSVWPQKANSGTPLWTQSYYLGYDMKPTCP
jgi:hypothetical protein